MGVKVRERPEKSGIYWIFIDHQTKRKAKKIGDKKTSLLVAKKIQAQLVLGDTGLLQKTHSFREVADRYLATIIDNPEYARKTQVKYQGNLRLHVLPVFGNKAIEKITRAELIDFLIKTRRRFSTSAIESRLTVLNGVFNREISEGLMFHIPTLNIKKEMHIKKQSPILDPLTFEESQGLLDVIKNHFVMYPYFYPLAFTALKSGLRIGELLGLKWEDIDFKGRYICAVVIRYELRATKAQ